MTASLDTTELSDILLDELFIDGTSHTASDRPRFDVVDPSTRAHLLSVAAATAADIDFAVSAARRAQDAWWEMRPTERATVLARVGELIRRDAELLAKVESLDTGKPLTQARTDVDVAAQYFTFYAGITDKLYGDTSRSAPPTSRRRSANLWG